MNVNKTCAKLFECRYCVQAVAIVQLIKQRLIYPFGPLECLVYLSECSMGFNLLSSALNEPQKFSCCAIVPLSTSYVYMHAASPVPSATSLPTATPDPVSLPLVAVILAVVVAVVRAVAVIVAIVLITIAGELCMMGTPQI